MNAHLSENYTFLFPHDGCLKKVLHGKNLIAEQTTSQVLNIHIETEDFDFSSIWEVFDKKLGEALDSEFKSIVLFLKKEMGHDDKFIDWIKAWYDKFFNYGGNCKNHFLISLAVISK